VCREKNHDGRRWVALLCRAALCISGEALGEVVRGDGHFTLCYLPKQVTTDTAKAARDALTKRLEQLLRSKHMRAWEGTYDWTPANTMEDGRSDHADLLIDSALHNTLHNMVSAAADAIHPYHLGAFLPKSFHLSWRRPKGGLARPAPSADEVAPAPWEPTPGLAPWDVALEVGAEMTRRRNEAQTVPRIPTP
jgi:hypothetical protein